MENFMVSVNTSAKSNDDLIARVAEGDISARQDLAARLQKLRWMGCNDEAKLLVAKIDAHLPKTEIDSEGIKETD
jgi:hypothetical protein